MDSTISISIPTRQFAFVSVKFCAIVNLVTHFPMLSDLYFVVFERPVFGDVIDFMP